MAANNNNTPDQLDFLILNNLQKNFPVAPRPYEVLASRLNKEYGLTLSEKSLWQRVRNLWENGYIRRLGAVFQAKTLGYQSTICAAQVPPDKIEKMANLVNAQGGVTHNYLRNDKLNMWFTFSGQSAEELSSFLARLKKETGLETIVSLPSQKLFKIKVDFKLGTE